MALHFHTLTVKEIIKETPDCVSILFEIPFSLEQEFHFKQGQSIAIRSFDNQEEIRRSYSICSSPLDKELRVAIKQVEGGFFSTFANSKLAKGDTLEVMSPSGNFYTDLSTSNTKNYIAFVAGSGITPLLSIIKTTLISEPASTFTLVYGNKNTASIIFKEQLESFKNKYMQRFTMINILSRERTESDLNYGRINIDKCIQLSKLLNLTEYDEYFLCGPESMIFSVKDYLESIGVNQRFIHFELFTTPVKKKNRVTNETQLKDNRNSSVITVKVDGKTFDFNLEYNSNNILDAALAEGADLPFACKGGVCCTCKARLVEGQVKMEVNYGLEPDEVEAGYILTCQSHPTSEKVIIDFDV